jgi:hemerythrin
MESWARKYYYYFDQSQSSSTDVLQFLCVCVDSNARRVAEFFHAHFDFDKVINAYIPSPRYMPRGFGQLGCSGFVIVDGNGNFVSRKTKAYLDFGNGAFDDVKQILAGLLLWKENGASGFSAGGSNGRKQSIDETDALIIPSTGVASMDHEHESCIRALRQLLEVPNLGNLQVVYDELVAHFAHEEALMVQNGVGGTPGDPFAPLTSHVRDHQRILSLVERELKPLLQVGTQICEAIEGVVAS